MTNESDNQYISDVFKFCKRLDELAQEYGCPIDKLFEKISIDRSLKDTCLTKENINKSYDISHKPSRENT